MKIDKPTTASLIGAFSTIPYEILTRVFKLLGHGKYSIYELTSLVITLNRPDTILGFFISVLIGASIAVIFYYAVIKWFGWGNLLLKSVFLSLQSWVLLEGIFMWLVEGCNFVPLRPMGDYYSQFFSVIAFGITMGLLTQKYLKN
ncbi:MAG: hypothetical protein GX050_05885 [Firmicutes bacterium]|nr:hypothetical protein [Bacillota bacterium]